MTAISGLNQVIQKNKAIRQEIEQCVMLVRTAFNRMQVSSPPQFAIQLLRTYGLVQMPIENPYLSGAIYVKEGNCAEKDYGSYKW